MWVVAVFWSQLRGRGFFLLRMNGLGYQLAERYLTPIEEPVEVGVEQRRRCELGKHLGAC